MQGKTIQAEFMGRGNTPEEAKEMAETRFQTFRADQRRLGMLVEELGRSHSFEARSAVHHKCLLKVQCSLRPQAAPSSAVR